MTQVVISTPLPVIGTFHQNTHELVHCNPTCVSRKPRVI